MEALRFNTNNEWLQTHLDKQIEATSEYISKLHQSTVSGLSCPKCKSDFSHKYEQSEGYFCKKCFHDWHD